MNRKEFLGKSISAGILPIVINGLSFEALADSPFISLLNKAGNEDRVLVLIQLNGGNDGLNTVIPLDQYDKIMASRGNIAITESKVLKLSGSQVTGLHPSMTKLRSLYDTGYVSILQSVGYPNQDYSHFRSTDIWLTATDSDKFVDTGWMGRYLDTEFSGFPVGFPNTNQPDPPAIQIGYMVSPALQGVNMSLGMSITDPTNFYQFVSGTVDPAPATPMGHELSFIRMVAQQTQQYSGSVKAAADKATNKSTLYTAQGVNTLSDQLKIVARLIAGGLKTKVYMVSLGGFDTHSSQVSASSGTETGSHANLLNKVSEAINAFQDDLKLLSIEDRVLGMTFSEFGRRIKSNDSLGTDHGAAAPVFIFGKKVNGGIYGSNPVIPLNASGGDNIAMQTDFRSVYASLLKDWFGVSSQLVDTLLYQSFATLPFVNGSANGIADMNPIGIGDITLYPNPASEFANIRFESVGSNLKITLFDESGRELVCVANQYFGLGMQTIQVDTRSFPGGLYFVQVLGENIQTSKKLRIEH